MLKKLLALFSGTKRYESISTGELAEILRKNKVELLDVRTTAEFQQGHIPSAKNFDVMSSSFQQKISKLDKSKTYYVYCRSGGRSASACSAMAKQGFTSLYNVRGGVMSWNGQLKR